MDFHDIEQIPQANYAVDVSLDSVEDTLARWAKYGLDLDPDFQRGYVWSYEQKVHYMEWILRGGRSGREIYFNHPEWMGGFKGTLVLIDGKQRLSAVRGFLRDEVKAFGHTCSEMGGVSGFEPSLRFCVFSFKTRKEVLKWYMSMNSGGSVHTDADLQKVRDLLAKEEG